MVVSSQACSSVVQHPTHLLVCAGQGFDFHQGSGVFFCPVVVHVACESIGYGYVGCVYRKYKIVLKVHLCQKQMNR